MSVEDRRSSSSSCAPVSISRRGLRSRRGLFCALLLVVAVAAGFAGDAGSEPASSPGSRVGSACDIVFGVVQCSAGVTSVQRGTGTYSDEAWVGPVRGCGLQIAGSFGRSEGGAGVADLLREDFSGRGWTEIHGYSADGKDGTAFAYSTEGAACHVRGRWNGGADGEPERERDDSYAVTVVCTDSLPRRE